MQNHHTFRSMFRLRLGLLLLLLLLSACGQLEPGWGSLLYNVSVTPDAITPNADGNADVTQISYSLRRTASVSIYFTSNTGEQYYFRQERRRSPGDYRVQWGGATDETRTVDTDYGPQEILSQVLPDGVYQWTIVATDDGGNTAEATGSIALQDGDTELPELHNFAVVPQLFKPNQYGLRDDWVSISYYLTKNVDSEVLYVVDPAKPALKRYIAPSPGLTKPNEEGYREYRYEGDVDNNAEPPPDGTYQIVGEARDRAGNAVRVVRELTIVEGGKPRAEVTGGEIDWSVVSGDQVTPETNRLLVLTLGDQLCFAAYVHNDGVTPIRTDGPWPGQSYQFTENRNTVALRHMAETRTSALPKGDGAWLQQAGVWRFGINYEAAGLDFPFRWAIGRQEDLERRVIDGQEQWYLLPKKSALVQGCIQFDEAPPLNTNIWWGGLIHESVAVVNNNIDRITVQVETPAEATP